MLNKKVRMLPTEINIFIMSNNKRLQSF